MNQFNIVVVYKDREIALKVSVNKETIDMYFNF